MLRTSGTITRLSEGSSTAQEDEVVYESDRLVSIVTSDVIDMVQQQGGAAEKVDHLGENMLVDGMLFDDFKPEDTYVIASTDDGADLVTLEIVEPRPASALDLGQLGDDDGARQGLVSILGIQSGFAGWTARVVGAGRVRPSCTIAKVNVAIPE